MKNKIFGLLSKTFRDRRGEGLNSMALGLMVVAGLVGMYYFLGGSTNEDQKIQRAQAQLTVIMKTMTDSFGTSTIVPAGSLNTALTTSGKMTSMTNPWGNAITVTGSGAQTYTISQSLPGGACSTLSSRSFGGMMQTVQIGANSAATSIDFGTSAAQCTTAGGVVTWTMVP